MSAVPEVTKTGPRTYVPAEVIVGGQAVEGRSAGRIGVAAAGSARFLGVALTDAQPPEGIVTTATVVGGRPTLVAAITPAEVAVAYAPAEVPVTYSAAAQFGDALVVTAGGKFAPATSTSDPRAVVARCTAPAGVAANATGLARIL